MHRDQKRRQLLEARAHAMRAAPTRSEEALSRLLSSAKLGVAVRRQHVVGARILDFAVPSAKLAIEVDGSSHAGRGAADAHRDRNLARLGWRVLRLDAGLVLREPEVAVERVRAELARAGLSSFAMAGVASAGVCARVSHRSASDDSSRSAARQT